MLKFEVCAFTFLSEKYAKKLKTVVNINKNTMKMHVVKLYGPDKSPE